MEDVKFRYMLEHLETMNYYLSDNVQGQDTSNEGEDNQQATLKDTELAWLAGFWDGEGTISLYNSPCKGRNRIQQNMSVCNTHVPTMERVMRLLKTLGVTYYVHDAGGNEKHKPRTIVEIRRLVSVHTLALAIQPYLFTKSEQCALLLRFVTRRVESDVKRMGYNDEDYYLYNALRQLNKKGYKEPQRLHAKSD